MSCEEIAIYDFCTVSNDTVFDKDFEVAEFDNSYDLKIEIYYRGGGRGGEKLETVPFISNFSLCKIHS